MGRQALPSPVLPTRSRRRSQTCPSGRPRDWGPCRRTRRRKLRPSSWLISEPWPARLST